MTVMTKLTALVIGAIAALALTAPVDAADAPDTWSPRGYENSRSRPMELMSGWYLRGDIGYRANRTGSVESRNAIVGENYRDGVGASVGVGHKYYWIRTDLTVDYGLRSTYRGATAAATVQPQYTAKIDALSIMANVYVDLGTWAGFTPYFGVGAGGSYLRNADYQDTTLPAGELVAQNTKWNPSWAAMAGVSYQIMPIWALDVGYRYLSLGDVGSSTDSTGRSTLWRQLSAHEFRIGARFMFD